MFLIPGESEGCSHRYILQPLRNLQCDPYIMGHLILDCEVTYDPTERAVELVWVFQPLVEDGTSVAMELSNDDSKYIITPERAISLDRSRLRVNNLNDSDAGSYACQILFANESVAMLSQQLDLFHSDVFAALRSPPCQQSVAHSESLMTCAVAGEVPTETTASPESPTTSRVTVRTSSASETFAASSLVATMAMLIHACR